ncbi:hypothetical protein GCM10027073_74330 [Streptomyces chlorus]|uniref:Integrase n=1 Tax=Streptomyces chlorus TaxID=887452 RepID=A0ABW1E8K8_9ACTN
MMARPSPAPLPSARFRDDEPVFGHSHQVIEGVPIPLFGDSDSWLPDCIGRPANRFPADWRITFPADDSLLNLQLRETAFALFNPTHPVLREAEIYLPAEPTAVSTVRIHCQKLQVIIRWAHKEGRDADLGQWDQTDWEALLNDRTELGEPDTVAAYINAVRALRRVVKVVTGVTPFGDPWGDRPASHVAWEAVQNAAAAQDGLSTPAIPPETWWPLLRAAWAYVHTFAPDIFKWRELFERHPAAMPGQAPRSDRLSMTRSALVDAMVSEWLAHPGNLVPVHAKELNGAPVGAPVWQALSKMITEGKNKDLFSARRQSARMEARRAAVLDAVERGQSKPVYATKSNRDLDAPSYRPTSTRISSSRLDDDVRRWLSDPANRVPVRGSADRNGEAGTPVLATLARLIWGAAGRERLDLRKDFSRVRLRMIEEAVAAGQVVHLDGVDGDRRGWRELPMPCPEAVAVTRPDGSVGPWRTEITRSQLSEELRMLRAACYVFIAAMSMMRDSEVQEIRRNALVTRFGSPALVSRKTKLEPARPELFWWIIEPVAEAVAVAERLSWHPTHLFATLAPPSEDNDKKAKPQGRRGIRSPFEIDFFIDQVNAHHDRLGLDKIPQAHVRSHMFRKTMSVITGQQPDGEIALGIQLKHAARRALANHTTQAYAQMDTKWAKEFDQQLEHAASLKLVDLLKARRNGETVAVGPGAGRLHAGLDKVIEIMNSDPQLRAQIADERVEASLLASEFPDLHLGTINHCMFDAPQAECQNQLPEELRGQAPLIGACQPDRCRNSAITRAHAPIWIAEEEDLIALAKEPRLAPPRREAVLIRLEDVQRITRALREEGTA